jgi:hypothetical protein
MEVYIGVIVFSLQFCALGHLLRLICLKVMHPAIALYL